MHNNRVQGALHNVSGPMNRDGGVNMSDQFTKYDLGFRSGGETVQVTLSGSAANVRLMDS